MAIIGTFAIIHRGHLDILDKYPNYDIYIIGDELAKKLYEYEIDLRKMPLAKMTNLLNSLNRQVHTLEENNIDYIKQSNQLVLIDDEVTEKFKRLYLTDHPNIIIENGYFYHPVENVYKTEEHQVNLIKNYTDQDIYIMKNAQLLASQSGCFWRQIASIIVKDNQVLYQAYNQMMPNRDECYKIGCIRDNFEPGTKTEVCSAVHSEANIIAQAARDGISLTNASIYVTTFPCPACAKLIALSGIKKCFYNQGWANFDGERIMKAYGVEIIKIDL